jgi:hypothetical protein
MLSDREFLLDAEVMQATRTAVRQLCERFPIPGYSDAGSEQPAGRYSSGDVPASLGQLWR